MSDSPWAIQSETVRPEPRYHYVMAMPWATPEERAKLAAIEGDIGGNGSNGMRLAKRVLKQLQEERDG